MKKGIIALMIVAVTLFALNAKAAEVSWKYGEIDYVSLTVTDIAFTGFGAAGTYDFGSGIYGSALFASLSGSGVTVTANSLSVGYKMSAAEGTDLFGQVNFVNTSSSGSSISDTNYSLGVRSMLNDKMEIGASATLGGTGDTAFGLKGVYYFTDNMGIGLGYATTTDVSAYTVGMRINI